MELENLASNFRMAIEAAKDKYGQYEFFHKFPTGQCGFTCDLLAQFFRDNGICRVLYVDGINHNYDRPHAWLEVDKKIVDITGDQFKDDSNFLNNDAPVYVGDENEFYNLFELNKLGKFQHIGFEEDSEHFSREGPNSLYSRLKKCYDIILRHI